MVRRLTLPIFAALCLFGCAEPISSGAPAAVTNPCVATDCDDGNPCTEDACDVEGCEHVAIPGCSDDRLACNALGLMDTATIVALENGVVWKAAVRAHPTGEPTDCTDAECGIDDPCCNTCERELALQIAGATLQPVVTDRDANWSCVADDCGETYSCEPLAVGSNYWLWGEVDVSAQGKAYVAYGWCRQTTAEELPGTYMGTWVSDVGEAHTIEVNIGHLGGWRIEVGGVRSCETCDYSLPAQTATLVLVGDGSLEFVVAVCGDGPICAPSARRDVKVVLSSHEDRLIGTFEEAALIQGLNSGEPYTGAVGLERLDL